jgi:hypothetical protein
MRRIVVSALLLLLLSFASSEAKRPAKGSTLCSIKTVYVAAYSESSVKVKDEVKKSTWLKVVSNPEKANAVLEVHETWGEHSSPGHGEMTITAVLKNDDGNLWTGTQSWGDGALNPDPKSAAKALMNELNAAAGGCK